MLGKIPSSGSDTFFVLGSFLNSTITPPYKFIMGKKYTLPISIINYSTIQFNARKVKQITISDTLMQFYFNSSIQPIERLLFSSCGDILYPSGINIADFNHFMIEIIIAHLFPLFNNYKIFFKLWTILTFYPWLFLMNLGGTP